jgi:hypothetical protein
VWELIQKVYTSRLQKARPKLRDAVCGVCDQYHTTPYQEVAGTNAEVPDLW